MRSTILNAFSVDVEEYSQVTALMPAGAAVIGYRATMREVPRARGLPGEPASAAPAGAPANA